MELLKLGDIAAALSLEAHRGIIDAFDLRLHKIRAHAGQIATAQNMLNLLEGSTYVTKQDRKSTRLNSSHANISYAVFCLKKKNLKQRVSGCTQRCRYHPW